MGDKLKVIAFTGGGYSLLPANKYMIGYMNGDGTIDWNRLNVLLQQISNAGAWGWREFPPWPTNHEAPISFQFLKPFYSVERQIVWNNLYFENLAKIFRFAHEVYNLIPIFDLFNGSETRVVGEYKTKEHSPWAVFKDYFYGDDSTETRHQWIDRIIDATGDIPVWFQQCNEPGTLSKHKAENMLADTIEHLLTKHFFPPRRMITGLDGFRKKKESGYRKMYNRWKEKVIDILIKHYKSVLLPDRDAWNKTFIKGEMVTPIHGMKNATFSDFVAHGVKPGDEIPQNGGRNICISTDGIREPRLNYFEARNLALKIINIWPGAIQDEEILLELVVGKEAMNAPYAQLEGAVSIIQESLGKPGNMGKFPKPLPIPSWVYNSPVEPINPEPEPKSITILSPSLGDTIYVNANNRNLTIGITWKSTGDIKCVYIQHCSDGGLWKTVAGREQNDGAHKLESANLVAGKNWIKISDFYGETQATQGFEVEFIYPEEKKMSIWKFIMNSWKFIMKNWRWSLAGIVIPASIYAVIFVSPYWYLLALPVLAGLVKFKVFQL